MTRGLVANSCSVAKRTCGGFSLIEVLIALLVIAVGMLGTGMLMAVSIRENQSAVTRSAAVLIANSMMDRMSANIVGVWQGSYDNPPNYAGVAAGPAGCDGLTVHCTPAVLAATRDRAQWQAEILQGLSDGNATGSVLCTPRSTPPTGAALAIAPVYDGFCEIELKWSDLRSDGRVESQDVVWRFVP